MRKILCPATWLYSLPIFPCAPCCLVGKTSKDKCQCHLYDYIFLKTMQVWQLFYIYIYIYQMFVSIDKMKKKPGEENLKDLVVNPSF